MTTLMQASQQWMTRPADQRFLSLDEMAAKKREIRENSISSVVANRQLRFIPSPVNPDKGITVEGSKGHYDPTHYSFGQLASLAGAPAGYLRKLHPTIVADALNYGMRFNRDVEEVGVLRTKTFHDGIDDADSRSGGDPVETVELRAALGPNYGRVWDIDVIDALRGRFGDGVTGDFKVPGEFGKDVPITRQNTTLYASDRDMFVFLADEKNRIEISDRRDGKPGSLARGFFVWNSEVGSQTLGLGVFLFDYVCMNRIVWGARDYKEIRIRHTSGAPDRFVEEVAPVLEAYANSAAAPVEQTLAIAQQTKLDMDLADFLKNKFSGQFSKSEVVAIRDAHLREEDRPVETIWDAVTAVTAHAKTIKNQDDRVAMERKGGAILDLVSDF